MSETSIQERWSHEIAKRGFTQVPTNFLWHYANLGLTPTDAMIVIHIMACKWDRRDPFPSTTRISKELGLSKSQVRARLARMQKNGILQRKLRSGRTTIYDLSGLIEKLEASIAKVRFNASETEPDSEEELDF